MDGMYAVIMAGGGGTRLHPLSRPERPKPFLPLLGADSLLQLTAARLPTDDITVVTDRRYEPLVRQQLPQANLLLEPMGRNTAAAIALATIAIDRPDDEVMIVVPADAYVLDDEGYRTVLRQAGESVATGAVGITDPLVTFGTEVKRPATEYGYLIPKLDRHALVDGLDVYPVETFEEKPKPARAEELQKMHGVAWNAGIFLWRRRAIRAALERYTGFIQSLAPMIGSPMLLEQAYESIQQAKSIDHAVMEGAARDGQVAMGSMNVGWSDLGSWTALLEAIGARGEGAVVQGGETVEVDGDDLVVRRVGGRVGVIAPLERGSMTATQPLAVLRGAAPDIAVIRGMLDRCAEPGG
jgi:mannose-1-phosphate guanylyltransferase